MTVDSGWKMYEFASDEKRFAPVFRSFKTEKPVRPVSPRIAHGIISVYGA